MTSLTSYQLLQSKSKKNKLSCEECERSHDNGHLYCIKFYQKHDVEPSTQRYFLDPKGPFGLPQSR